MKKFTLLLVMLLLAVGGVKADVEWTIWEGSYTFNNEGSSNGLDLSNCFAILEAGDNLKFELSVTDGADYQQMYLAESYSENTLIQKNWETITGNFSQEVTSDIYSYLVTNSGKMTISGKGYTLTKVAISKAKSYIRSYLNNGSAKIENLNGAGASVPNENYNYTVAGDYIYLDLSNVDSEIWVGLNGNGSSYIINSNFKNPYFMALTDDDVTNLKAGYGYLQCVSGITIKSASLLHPVNSFSIGSIGYATFSASQQVTAPASVKAYKATVDGSTVKLTQFTDNVIPANTGAIIAGDEGAVLEFTASSASTSETSDLIACTTATDVSTLASGYDYYVLYPGTGASETELVLSTLLAYFNPYNSDANISWNSSTYTLSYTGTPSNSSGGWVGSDWSAYDKLKLTFATNTLSSDASIKVTYQASGSSASEGTLAVGEKSITITLNDDYKNSIGNLDIWTSSSSGSLTFESAALIDSDGATVAEFRKTTSGTLAANKAYLKIPSSSARALDIVFDDGNTTAISSVEKPVINDNVYYNLRGQRIANPTKGLYIVNGKKVIIK